VLTTPHVQPHYVTLYDINDVIAVRQLQHDRLFWYR